MEWAPPTGSSLLGERHLRELHDDSSIPLDLIAERGYRSVDNPRELLTLGFADYQSRPGLLIPLHGADGSNGRFALKPDQPRTRDGKVVKYEYVAGQRPILDVPVRCLEQLADASIPLLFTEGPKKADYAAGRGYCSIDVFGVHNWYRNPAHGGFATIEPLADWDVIKPTLDGRICYVAFDSDAWSKPSVALALRRLANFLARAGALVSIVKLPDAADGSKQGIDDVGDEVFDACTANAEPWGSIGQVRQLRARVAELEHLLSAQAAVLRNPGLRPTEKLVAIATIHEAGWAKSAGKPTPYKVNYGRLAEASGVSPQTVSTSIKALSDDDHGLFTRTTSRELTEQGEWQSNVKLEPRHTGGVVELLHAAATYAPPERPSWGGKRVPRCPDHPDARVMRRETLLHFDCGCVVDEARALNSQDDSSEEPRNLVRFNGPETKPAAIVAGLFRKAFSDASTAIELTRGNGGFWSDDEPVSVQVDTSPHDFTKLPYADASYDVVVFDPPHNADASPDSIMALQYGTYSQADLEQVIRQGAAEAWRVARLGVIVKVTEQVHGQEFVAERDWVTEAIGQAPYDLSNGMHHALHREAPYSVLNNGSTYLAYRKGDQSHKRRLKQLDRYLKCQDDNPDNEIEKSQVGRVESPRSAPLFRTTGDKRQVSDNGQPPRASPKKKVEESPIWRCGVCSAQMFGGPRCYEHNPPPGMRPGATP